MPRDPRLYMTFPIDFDEHPKVEPLSDVAFRTFVAMNGYSRRHRLDGRIPEAVAAKRWKAKALDELLASHPERPLLLLDAGDYVIREYAEHQFTTADEEELRSRKARAGALGGRAKAAAIAGAKHDPQQDLAGSESGSGIPLDVTNSTASSPEIPVGAEGLDAALLTLVSEKSSVALDMAKRSGVKDLYALHGLLETAVGEAMTPRGAIELVDALLTRSRRPVVDVDAYVATACRDKPASVREAFVQFDIGAVA